MQVQSMKGSAVLAALMVCASAGGAYAQQPEAIEFWDKVRVGSKLCLADHEHYGESPSWPSERGARIMAIKKWESFTTWEYGKAWGSYKLAVAKNMKCNSAGGRWVCGTTARPCRRR